MSVDPETFRDALGRFASGVCVVTTTSNGDAPAGVTITSFTSLSLDPPLVLFCIGRRSTSIGAFLACSAFAINLLSARQEELSELFASQRPDKFAGIAWQKGANGCPLLSRCLGSLECDKEIVHPAGDHVIVVGKVVRFTGAADDEPLLRFRGRYHRLGGG
jgi:flavin reductase (DIM6/NTAB) family NADH-FMN oxidoreductase RutF